MKMNCIIVEDEPAARKLLEKYTADCPSLNLISSCKNAFEASEVLNQSDVALIFLDINMPKLSGLAFYKSLTKPPYVIFTTAYPEYAIEGFELDAVDYLLKPFPFERFLKAVNKALSKYQQTKTSPNNSRFLILKSDKKLYRVEMNEISYLEAFGDYVKIHCLEKSIMVHDTLQGLMEQLPEQEFVRVHKSFAIAFHKLDHVEGNMVHLGNMTLPIGQTYRADFFKLIKA